MKILPKVSAYKFEPREDITAYEVAYILNHINMIAKLDILHVDEDKIIKFENSIIYRHFRVINDI